MILSQVAQNALRAGAASASIVGQVFYFLDLPLGQPMYVIHLRVINENVALKAARLPYTQGARNARIASSPAAPTRRSRACFVVSALKLSGSQVLYQITNLLMWTVVAQRYKLTCYFRGIHEPIYTTMSQVDWKSTWSSV
jgi:hypothetical protein